MSSKEEMMEKYEAQLKDLGVGIDAALLDWCVDRVGPANYNADGQLVSCSDESEVNTVYTNFVADELAETDKDTGMAHIMAVCEQMSGQSRKYRAVFYYLLAKRYEK